MDPEVSWHREIRDLSEEAPTYSPLLQKGSERVLRNRDSSSFPTDSLVRSALVLGLVGLSSYFSIALRPARAVEPQFGISGTKPVEIQKETTFDDFIMVGYSDLDKVKTQALTREQVTHYQTEPLIAQRVERVKKWEGLVRETIAEPGLKIPEIERKFWEKWVMAIIYVESEGDETADSGIALGLVQVKPSTAEKIAKELNISNYQLKDPKTNIRFGVKQLQELLRVYKDPSLATWAYHLGMGNMDFVIKTYASLVARMPDSELNEILEGMDRPGTSILSERFSLNATQLTTQPAVTGALKQRVSLEGGAKEYFFRVMAAQKLLS